MDAVGVRSTLVVIDRRTWHEVKGFRDPNLDWTGKDVGPSGAGRT
jgi:hypothetical protein